MSRALITDLYQITMLAAYYDKGMHEERSTFELFVRKLPENRNYLIAAGLEQAVEYLTDLHFEKEDIEYLKGLDQFKHVKPEFWNYLANFRFTGNLRAVPEGTYIFPEEPILSIEGPTAEVQLVETYLLSVINFQTMIATKASRIVQAARGKPVIDFGTRRAHGPEAGVYAARAAYIGGCAGTSNVEAGRLFNIPVSGTMAHSWVMKHSDEAQAFQDYAKVFPDHTIALIDTYDVEQGARNALSLEDKLKGVRIDSGDLLENSKLVRKILDEAGLKNTKIFVSGDLNEYKIYELMRNSAPIDGFGVGTELVTSKDAPTLGGVYKLVADESGPKMKTSEGKRTLPGEKQVYRVYKDIHISLLEPRYDIISLNDEPIDVPELHAMPLLEEIMKDGRLIKPRPSINYSRKLREKQRSELLLFTGAGLSYPVRYSSGLKNLLDKLNHKPEEVPK